MGDLVAIEIKTKHRFTILISSVTTKIEFSGLFRWMGKSELLKVIPEILINIPRSLTHYLFGAKNTDFLDQIVNETD